MKKILYAVMILAIIFALSGCNYSFLDSKWNFDTAIIKMPSGEVVTIEVSKWSDAEGEQLTIAAKDGTVYLVSSVNCVLIESEEA